MFKRSGLQERCKQTTQLLTGKDEELLAAVTATSDSRVQLHFHHLPSVDANFTKNPLDSGGVELLRSQEELDNIEGKLEDMAVANPYQRKNWEEWKRQMEENRRKRWRERVRRWLNPDVSDEEDDDVEEEEEDGEEMESNEEDVNVDGVENVEGEKRDEAKKEETDEEGGSRLQKRFQEKKNEEQDEDGGMSEGDARDVEEEEDAEELDGNQNEEVREAEDEEKLDADAKEEKSNDTKSEAAESEKMVEMVEEIQLQEVNDDDDDDDDEQHQEQPGRYHLEEELADQISHRETGSQEDVEGEKEDDFSDSDESDASEASETSSTNKDGNQYDEKQDEDSTEREHVDKKSWRNENGLFEAWAMLRNEKARSEKSTGDEETATASWQSQKDLQDDDEDIQQESVDEEEAECSADEDEEYDDDEDEVKIYSKDDYPVNLFLTLSEFRDSSLLTDLTLQTEDGQSFCVHTPVLAAVSSLIWKNLGRSKVENSRTNERIHIDRSSGVRVWSVSFGPEVDHAGLEAVVEFAYSGLISLNKRNLEQVKAAAQTLGVPRVLDLCAKEEEWLAQSAGKKKKEQIPAAQQLMISLQSIKQMWMDRVGCDVILETLSRSLHVHRAVLAASSDYFRGMFTLGMKESNQPCVSLPFLLASELEALVDSSYSGALSISWTCVFEITSTALQLQYQPALSLCLSFLQQEINPHTCLDVVAFAEAYEITHLLEVADDFVLRQFQKVAGTSKFKDMPAKQLSKYLNSHSLCVPSELVVFKAVVAWIQANPSNRLRLAKELMKAVHFPLMTFMEFKEVQSQNMWADPSLADLYETIFEDFCSNETALQNQCRIYLPKESLVLTGGDQISEDLGSRSISRDIWFGNSLRNHTGIKKAMEWRRLGEMPEPARFSHEVAVLNGELYVFGGKRYYGIDDTLNSVYRYDPLQNSWEYLHEMLEKRCSFSVVVLDGKVYAIGGHCDPDHNETVECYCPSTNSWSFTCPLDLPLSGHAARVLQGQIFISGGQNSDYLCLASMILYHPEAGSTYLANMTRSRANHCMEILGEYLYVAGGITTHDNMVVTDQLACEVYNPAFDFWTAFEPLPVPHVGAGSAVLEGKFYVLGGYSQEDYSDTKMVHRYDASIQKWENMGKMPGPNNELQASVLRLPQHFRL